MTRDYVGEALGKPQSKASEKDTSTDSGRNGADVISLADERAKGDWPIPDFSLVSDDRLPPPALNFDALPPAWVEWIKQTAEDCGSTPDSCRLQLDRSRVGSPW